jgi:hypothetical protein
MCEGIRVVASRPAGPPKPVGLLKTWLQVQSQCQGVASAEGSLATEPLSVQHQLAGGAVR